MVSKKEVIMWLFGAMVTSICGFLIYGAHLEDQKLSKCIQQRNIQIGIERMQREAVMLGRAYWGSDTNGNPIFMWKQQ